MTSVAENAESTREEWLALGVEQGWCSTPVCCTHDEVPVTDTELHAFDNGADPCIHAVRLWATK